MKIEEQIVALREVIETETADIARRQQDIYRDAELCRTHQRQLKELEALVGCVVMPASPVEN